MKKFYLVAAMAACVLVGNAQEMLRLSTYQGTNLQKYDGKQCQITVDRYVFNGWNTVSLPFAMNEAELNEVFGSDCKLEKLAGVEAVGSTVVLNFMDCKAQGLEPNTPYILHYTGNTGNVKINKEATVADRPSSLTYNVEGTGETVTMIGAQSHVSGMEVYGVLARDNAEAKFVKVEKELSNVYATRCFIEVGSNSDVTFVTNHIGSGETTSISKIATAKTKVDVYGLSGARVATNMRAADVNKLPAGIYVVNGQKVLVK